MAENDQDQSQKTEEPTDHKLREARKKGDVHKSQEVSGAAVLAVGGAAVLGLGGFAARDTAAALRVFFEQPHLISADAAGFMQATTGALLAILPWFAAIAGALVVAALAGHLGQTGLMFAPAKIVPKFSKISPLAGAKRMFGPQALSNFLKGLGKIALVGAAVGAVLGPRWDELVNLPQMPPAAVLSIAQGAVAAFLICAVAVYAVIAVADYVMGQQSFTRRMRMTKQEVKDEHKQAEGDPHVKARLRQIRAERSKRRMLAAVPEATVVIANPTHYAVALRYEPGETPAPICVAKGVDALALKIRETAESHDVPVIEDPPLARALHASVELDRVIPEQHFKAVAKVIGYVLGLARRRGRGGR